MKHFEDLWEEAEKLNAELKTPEISEILEDVKELLEDYKISENESIPKDIRVSIKERKFGEIIFKLSQLSYLENVNVYSALRLEIDKYKIEKEINNK